METALRNATIHPRYKVADATRTKGRLPKHSLRDSVLLGTTRKCVKPYLAIFQKLFLDFLEKLLKRIAGVARDNPPSSGHGAAGTNERECFNSQL